MTCVFIHNWHLNIPSKKIGLRISVRSASDYLDNTSGIINFLACFNVDKHTHTLISRELLNMTKQSAYCVLSYCLNCFMFLKQHNTGVAIVW